MGSWGGGAGLGPGAWAPPGGAGMGGPSRFPPGRPGLLGVTSTRVRSPPRGRPRLLPGQPPPFPAHPAPGRGWREGAQGPRCCWAGVGPGIGFADCQAPAVALRSCRDGIGGLLPGLGTSRDLGTGGSGTCQASPSVMWPLVVGAHRPAPSDTSFPIFETQNAAPGPRGEDRLGLRCFPGPGLRAAGTPPGPVPGRRPEASGLGPRGPPGPAPASSPHTGPRLA